MFYLLLDSLETRTKLIDDMKKKDIMMVFHYVPLHSSPAGQRFAANPKEELPITDMISSRLVRLPFYYDQTDDEINYVCDCINQFFGYPPRLNKYIDILHIASEIMHLSIINE